MPARAQAPLTPDESYQRIVGELYPDEIAPFYGFYASLGQQQRAVLARVIGDLEEGEWGLFAVLLFETERPAADKILKVFGSFDASELDSVAATMRGKDFEAWRAIPVLAGAESFETARAALLSNGRTCVLPEEIEGIDDGMDADAPAPQVCSEAEAAFFIAFFPPPVRRVTRGVRVRPGDIPWQAQLSLHGDSTKAFHNRSARDAQVRRFGRRLEDWEINHTCGAVYMGGKFVLTAAHCIGNLEDEKFFKGRRVHLGSVQIDQDRNLFKIRTVLVHASYNPQNLQNDIALIELEKVPTGLRELRSAKLPRAPARPSGQVPLTLSGWGYQRPASSSNAIFALDGRRQIRAASSLLRGTVWVQQLSVCRNNRHFRRREISILPGQLCIGSPTGVDSCRGDSGGPVVNQRTEVLVGIVSGGAGCGLRGTPSVYVDVGYYRDWIDRAMESAPRLRAKRKYTYR